MKKIIYLFMLLLCIKNANAQDQHSKLYEKLKQKSNYSNDIYNPINYTNITERMPKDNGKNKRYTFSSWTGLDYIKKGSNIHIEFDKEFVDALGEYSNIQILAYIQRKDKSIKPLSVFGFTSVKEQPKNIETIKQGVLSEELESENIEYVYSINSEKNAGESYSGELNLAWEDISDDDKIVIHITNKAKNNTGFTLTLIYNDFGWVNSPTGGFSFVKIAEKDFKEFTPAASLGYSFRYKPRKSSSFSNHFFSPSFGPMLHVFQNGENTTIGAGVFISTFYNMVNFGGGYTINGVNHGKPYFSIGLNFIESYNTISNLLK